MEVLCVIILNVKKGYFYYYSLEQFTATRKTLDCVQSGKLFNKGIKMLQAICVST